MESINFPADIRKLSPKELPALAQELREYFLESVAKTGGHLSAGLGVAELTVALHYVFDTPNDKLIWDVGHQAYIHKMLTGRREALKTIKQKNGLSGFPKRSESHYDEFGVGHSSTSIGAALGMALAAKQNNKTYQSIAVIGDGAMTAGMAYEALNHAGDLNADLLVILNDNDMSISPNVGGLRKHLTRLISGRFYSKVRNKSKRVLSNIPSLSKVAKLMEEHTLGMVLPGTFFEEMGFNYYGPVNGHDINELIVILNNLKKIKGPRLLHIVTKKGKGYEPAEKDPCAYHGVAPFDLKKGIINNNTYPSTPTYTEVFGQWLCDMAEQDKRLVGITPAMREGSGMVEFSQRFADRYFDVAIAEQHAVTLAAGLACEGIKPVVAIYSSFLQRAYDQLLHDVAIQNLPVLFAIDRAGLVGSDGPTHSGNFDISFLRCVPNMIIMTPADENECRQMLYTGFMQNSPVAVRYPRGKGIGIQPHDKMQALKMGKSKQLRQGKKIAILLFGPLLEEAQAVAKNINATLINMRFVKPLDENILRKLSIDHQLFVTIEDNVIMGGAGSAVNESLHKQNISLPVLNLGLPDKYIDHATRSEQLKECGLSIEKIQSQIEDYRNTA